VRRTAHLTGITSNDSDTQHAGMEMSTASHVRAALSAMYGAPLPHSPAHTAPCAACTFALRFAAWRALAPATPPYNLTCRNPLPTTTACTSTSPAHTAPCPACTFTLRCAPLCKPTPATPPHNLTCPKPLPPVQHHSMRPHHPLKQPQAQRVRSHHNVQHCLHRNQQPQCKFSRVPSH
jgi:hypothetical protein